MIYRKINKNNGEIIPAYKNEQLRWKKHINHKTERYNKIKIASDFSREQRGVKTDIPI